MIITEERCEFEWFPWRGQESGFGSPGRAKTGGKGLDKANGLFFRKERRGREGFLGRKGRSPARAEEGVLPRFGPEEEPDPDSPKRRNVTNQLGDDSLLF